MRKLKILFEFYKSNILIYIILLVISVVIDVYSSFLNLMILGTGVTFLRRYFYQNEYYFYYNQSISRTQLYGFCMALNFLVSTITVLLYEAFS
jgi:hypothetical protein